MTDDVEGTSLVIIAFERGGFTFKVMPFNRKYDLLQWKHGAVQVSKRASWWKVAGEMLREHRERNICPVCGQVVAGRSRLDCGAFLWRSIQDVERAAEERREWYDRHSAQER